ncbi:MAG: hypothetical protein CM15mP18_3330 [Methanobacteriota archaeon]|nr:MAG: hypothetical protein CM15mP18_3330 [Euryarchaeota archaeon]
MMTASVGAPRSSGGGAPHQNNMGKRTNANARPPNGVIRAEAVGVGQPQRGGPSRKSVSAAPGRIPVQAHPGKVGGGPIVPVTWRPTRFPRSRRSKRAPGRRSCWQAKRGRDALQLLVGHVGRVPANGGRRSATVPTERSICTRTSPAVGDTCGAQT